MDRRATILLTARPRSINRTFSQEAVFLLPAYTQSRPETPPSPTLTRKAIIWKGSKNKGFYEFLLRALIFLGLSE